MKRANLSSYAICCAVVLLASAVASRAVAQKTEADIKARLIRQPLYLRGQWSADKLAFDDAGHLEGKAGVVTFTLSGVEIDSVKLSTKGLTLDGQRVGLEFTKDVPKRVPLLLGERGGGTSPENITIKIKTPVDGDFTSALNAIFADQIAELGYPLPEYWQQFGRKHLLPSIEPAVAGSPSPGNTPVPQSPESAKVRENAKAPETATMRKIGGGVTAPRVLTQAEPEFSPSARALKYQGLVLVSLIVGTDGIPTHLQVLRPAGLGLDELAVAAVSGYTFTPAMEGGKPVPVMLNVEVNFQIF